MPADTVVLQSFRLYDVPDYVSACLASVKAWATERGFAYRFVDDELFDGVPEWFKEKANVHMESIADVARLLEAKRLLSAEFGRVIWVDADVLIFNRVLFSVPFVASYNYCRETWLDLDESGQSGTLHRVNNCVCGFTEAALDHIDDYVGECYRLASNVDSLSSGLEVGTDILSSRFRMAEHITQVGIASPLVIHALLYGKLSLLRQYAIRNAGPIYAINMCNSYRRRFKAFGGIVDNLYSFIVNVRLADASSEAAEALSVSKDNLV